MAIEKNETMNEKEIMLKVAWAFLGRPYLWGGDDPMAGFDCSGYIIECLKSAGKLPRKGDWTAQGLWDRFAAYQTDQPQEGCLIFWANRSGKVVHVELCINNELAIGASGGGGKTMTGKDAIEQNAYIKVRPFRSRSGIKGYVDLFKA
jgi:murein DD-endopeptidase